MFALLIDLFHIRKRSGISTIDCIFLVQKDDMNKIETNGCWELTAKGWQHICDHDERHVIINRRSEQSRQASLNTTHISPIEPQVWECVIAYINSPTDLRNLAATCRSLHKLVESELAWSYLIRTKFGYPLWLRHVRQIFYQQNNQQIDFHLDIETMERLEIAHQCATIPATFLLNRVGDDIIPLRRAILRSYRYHLEIEASKYTTNMAVPERVFRYLVSFTNIHSEHLSEAQRQTVPLTKLIYFYLTDQRRVPVVSFDILCLRE